MEDFLILLISLIVYLVAASSGRKKKKRRDKSRRRSQPVMEDLQQAQAFAPAFEKQLSTDSIRQENLTATNESEKSEAQSDEAPYEAETGQDLHAQDLLRGVIMSEILTRPQDRAVWGRNRRGYHG